VDVGEIGMSKVSDLVADLRKHPDRYCTNLGAADRIQAALDADVAYISGIARLLSNPYESSVALLAADYLAGKEGK